MTNHVLIIAEAGVNHNGSLENAKLLIDIAAEAGVDFVKFQTFKADKLVSKDAAKASYQVKNLQDEDTSQFAMLKKLEMPYEWHEELITYCQKKEVRFLSTAFDIESVYLLDKLGCPLFKIPSGSITDRPYLEAIAKLGKPVILSTGMATLGEVEDAIEVLLEGGTTLDRITVLHCNTEYPTPMSDVNLRAMNSIGKELGVKIGYSDHTLGIEVPIAATALGATVIEKHFTIDRNLPGPDHLASLEPNELKQMVRSIRNIEKAISGSGVKQPSSSEIKNIVAARKSLHLVRDVKANHVLEIDDLITQRPGDGISPMEIHKIVGKIVLKDLNAGTKLTWDLLQK